MRGVKNISATSVIEFIRRKLEAYSIKLYNKIIKFHQRGMSGEASLVFAWWVHFIIGFVIYSLFSKMALDILSALIGNFSQTTYQIIT